jgi:hypothetical protein
MAKSSTRSSSTPNPTGTPAPSPATPARGGSTPPTHEQIAARAYEIYLARGGFDGRSEDDWLQAERELRLGRQ